MPSQLKQINPLFSFCNGGLFTAYDPPSALNAATALAPPMPPPPTPNDPKIHSWTPVPNPTIDPGVGQKGDPKASMPVPANTVTLDQPKVTINTAATPPKHDTPHPGFQHNDPTTQQNPPPQPRPIAVKPNSDPKVFEDPQQGSNPKQGNDPNKVSDPKQVSGIGGQSGQEADSEPNSDPKQVDPVKQNDPKQTDNANNLSGFSESQAMTINNQVVQPLSHGISIAGTTLIPGAPPLTVSGTLVHLESSSLIIGTSTVLLSSYSDPVTTDIAGHIIEASSDAIVVAGTTLTRGSPPIIISGTPIYFGPSALVVGTSTVALAPKNRTPMITTVAGKVITAAPNAVTIAGTVLAPGAPGVMLGGTLLSLNTASQLIIGPKTIPLRSTFPDSITTTIGGQVITALANKVSIGGAALTPGASGVTMGGTLVSLNTAGQLVIGSKTIALQSGSTDLGEWIMGGLSPVASSEVADPITTTIDGQVITAGPTALAMAGTTLDPGAPAFTINGTLVSLNTDSQLVVGSKTISLESGKAGQSGQRAGLGGLIMGGFGLGGPFGPFASGSPPSTQGNVSTAATIGTGNGVQEFAGDAVDLKRGGFRSSVGLSMVGMVVLVYLC